MSVEMIRKRYINIAKQSLSFLKEEGFKKKGSMYYQDKKDLTLGIGTSVPQSWMNDENSYGFDVFCEITATEDDLIKLYSFVEKRKNIKKVFLTAIGLFNIDLNKNDPLTRDQELIDKIKLTIKSDVLPKITKISCIDDLILAGESELHLPERERFFFPIGIMYKHLAFFYAFKELKEKTLEACEKYLENAIDTSKDLAEARVKRYVQYFEQKGL